MLLAAFTLLDGTPDDAEDADYLAEVRRQAARRRRPAAAGLAAALAELAAESTAGRRARSPTARRGSCSSSASTASANCASREDDFGFGRARREREPSPAERFHALLRDGPPVGIHVIVWCDSLTNLNRAFDRPQLREFAHAGPVPDERRPTPAR